MSEFHDQIKHETLKADHGRCYPLGATIEARGVNFALFSQHAQRVELCLFDEDGKRELATFELHERSGDIWHIFIEGLREGACYGYRVHGPYEPKKGLRFNANKLLIDPYSKELRGDFVWHDSQFGYASDHKDLDLIIDERDNAEFVPKSVVTAALPPPEPIKAKIDWRDMVIYEAHVKGLTKLHSRLPENIRGTYAGLAHPEVIGYLLDLGVTSIELLPVHQFIDENFLTSKGLTNYWGYNTLNFFVPHAAYAASSSVRKEFRDMVSAMHKAGIEVILDVVYNHTAEGNHLGPSLNLRGIDNSSYYSLESESARYYVNDTGCGNTLNIKHPRVRQLVLDSLRYWAQEMGVDGFRFDLASVLGRGKNGFNRNARFFELVAQDPVLSQKKMIAEPWDIGPGGYQLGNFPNRWAEWNDKYRDTVRRFWRGDGGMLPEFARRIHGSNELFEHARRRPSAGINFVAAHDGFTVRDIVSYERKHNQANSENNRDGHSSNYSHNHGVEGVTDSKEINRLRERQQRNLLATLLLSQGTPMLNMGDELSRTQGGNNNAYCQDNEISWLDWDSLRYPQWQLKSFVRHVIDIRKRYPILRCRSFIHKPDEDGDQQKYNIHWLNAGGEAMSEKDWSQENERCLAWMLESIENKSTPRCLISLFNAKNCSLVFNLPSGWRWKALLDTREQGGKPTASLIKESEDTVELCEKSMVVIEGEK